MDLKSKIEELGNSIANASMQAANQTTPTIRSGHTTIIIIGDNNHVAHPNKADQGPCIDQATRATLRDLVAQIVAKKQATQPDYPAYKVWQRLNETMGVETYKHIPETQSKRAIAYLQGWLRNITPAITSPS